MRGRICYILILLSPFVSSAGKSKPKEDVGEALFLTPYIEQDKIDEAKGLALVKGLTGDVESYSGFVTVHKEYNSNLFLWYIVSKNKNSKCLILSLEGGPGNGSAKRAFFKFGPWRADLDSTYEVEEYSWHAECHLLMIDNPVGSGFSFTDNDAGYAKNMNDVAVGVKEALRQFFKMFSNLAGLEFYIVGLSYGARYAVALANLITTANNEDKNPDTAINLAGLMLGNQFCDPKTTIGYSELFYQTGMLNAKTRDEIAQTEKRTIEYIEAKKWIDAKKEDDSLLLVDGPLSTAAGYVSMFNYASYGLDGTSILDEADQILQQPAMRQSLHVGNTAFGDYTTVFNALLDQFMQSTEAEVLARMMEKYRTILYYEQFRALDAYSYSLRFIEQTPWNSGEEYKKAERKIWKVDNYVAGYSKTANLLTELLLRTFGYTKELHEFQFTFEMMRKFVNNEPF